MYVSRWWIGGIARARRQYTKWLASIWIVCSGIPEKAEIWANDFVGFEHRT